MVPECAQLLWCSSLIASHSFASFAACGLALMDGLPIKHWGLICVHMCMSALCPLFRGNTVFWPLFCRLVCQEGTWCICYSYDANAQASSPASHFCINQCMAFQLNSVACGHRGMTLFSLLKSMVGWLWEEILDLWIRTLCLDLGTAWFLILCGHLSYAKMSAKGWKWLFHILFDTAWS